MKDKLKKALPFLICAIMIVPMFALADGDTTVSGAITAEAGKYKTEVATVIASALGLGFITWGAKMLWGKFKSMAK